MKLADLLPAAGQDIEIAGLTADSRAVRDGYLFAALPGSKEDGSKFIADALYHGAAAVLAKTGTPPVADVPMITDDNPRRAFALACARFYARQPQTIAAVTGTSGKTSTVSFAQQLWHLSGIKSCASLGTLGLRGPGMMKSGALTTPSAEKLMAELADLSAAGITHLAMEASSHGLDQYRLDGVRVSIAAYTNLSRDHLDYHADMDEYFAAKSRLFTDLLKPGGVAVIASDDAYASRLIDICRSKKIKMITAGKNARDIVLKNRVAMPEGQQIDLDVMGAPYHLTLPLVGEFQVMNVLVALGIVIAGGVDPSRAVPMIESLRGVPGRLQLVPGHPRGAAVYVDYAHKPAAVESVLTTLRPHTRGKLFCVIGCGGDRDPGKRPIMGKIASDLADMTVITDDNPRTEDAGKIRAAMMSGISQTQKAKDISGRREAIQWAVAALQAGDVLVIAGKGHEQGQIVGETVLPFDDVTESKQAMENIKG
jgi:UDP-N-acetylmuramoyl-L-alanyl-D-glutamate--2,6-diaminopimelate ligase